MAFILQKATNAESLSYDMFESAMANMALLIILQFMNCST